MAGLPGPWLRLAFVAWVAQDARCQPSGAFYLHVPGTGGSTVSTALHYYACTVGLRRCPITRGVKYHDASDAYWDALRGYDVVAAHVPGVNVSGGWRRGRATGAVLTTLRDPVTYAMKHALASSFAEQRMDLQWQYLLHGWRRDPSREKEARLGLREASTFLRENFDVVGLVPFEKTSGLFDAFVVRCGLRLTGRPDALRYVAKRAP
jgi:hypothetical protein